MRRWSVLVLAALMLGGCSPREPQNPLDPANPDTGGQPRWLIARADLGAVDLDWSVPFTYDDLIEVWLIRTNDDVRLWQGSPGPNTLRDAPRPNGVEVGYRLELQLASGGVTELPIESATPGPAIPWVVDDGAARVRRLAPDGRTVRLTLADDQPLTVEADPDSGDAVVASFFEGTVNRYAPDGTRRWSRQFDTPAAVLRTPDGWWVADAGLGAVVLLDGMGEVLHGDTSFVFPVDLAPAGPRAVWVADRWGELARVEVDADSAAVRLLLDTPIAVAATGNGGVWVAVRGFEAVLRLDANGTELVRADGLPGVIDLEPDPVLPDGVWGADRGNRGAILLDAGGNRITLLPSVAPSTLGVSPDGTEIWVADPAENKVIRFSRDGVRLAVAQGVGSPTSISVAWSPRRP